MAKIVVNLNGNVLGQYFLDKPELTVGRRSECDIPLDDPSVSKLHIRIDTIGKDQILNDCSSNGTLVNGVRVLGKHILQHGDVIGIAAFQLKYLNQKVAGEVDFDKTMIISGLKGVEKPAAQSGEAVSARLVRTNFPLGRLKVLAGARPGRDIALAGPITLLGEEGETLAALRRRPHGYQLLHVSGEPAPLVNGSPVKGEARPLKSGDVLEVGTEKLEFSLQ